MQNPPTITWKLLRQIAWNGRETDGDNAQAFQLHVGMTGSKKRRRFTLLLNQETGRIARGRDLVELESKYPGLIEEVRKFF